MASSSKLNIQRGVRVEMYVEVTNISDSKCTVIFFLVSAIVVKGE